MSCAEIEAVVRSPVALGIADHLQRGIDADHRTYFGNATVPFTLKSAADFTAVSDGCVDPMVR